ncbi:LysR family transcriptional regulator [Actinomadura sp. KC216]|uniref:LysR substrate-binding domain-containing protein n=1 Tax=Actinomadura sp. KC216 TaxID=2530370 RepID=UPI00104D5E4F|nr:LysR substrate-binding domain-containing protein [Actinomadura sp. KC216]TDB90606.1 LysR family transcriptional regulator [Actinomadura sp. KC216]
MRPTQARVVVIEHARRALGELDRTRAEVRPSPGMVTGIVTVGLLESTADLLSGPLVAALARDQPGIDLRLFTAYSGHLQLRLGRGDLDLILLYDMDSTPSLNAQPLVRGRPWAVAPPSACLHADRPVPFARVAENIMTATGHGLRALIDAAAARARVDETQMDVVVQTNSMQVQKRLVLAGHGWTILPGWGSTPASRTARSAPLPCAIPKSGARSSCAPRERDGRHPASRSSPGN